MQLREFIAELIELEMDATVTCAEGHAVAVDVDYNHDWRRIEIHFSEPMITMKNAEKLMKQAVDDYKLQQELEVDHDPSR